MKNQSFLGAIALYSLSQAGGKPTLIIDKDSHQSSQEVPNVPQSHRVTEAGGRFLLSQFAPPARKRTERGESFQQRRSTSRGEPFKSCKMNGEIPPGGGGEQGQA